MSPTFALCAIAAVVLTAAIAIFRATRAEAARRRDALLDCAHLLRDAERGQSPSGWGLLRGLAEGRSSALTAIAETLVFRRLPQLWISAAVSGAPGTGVVAIVRRPSGGEFFTGANRLPLAFVPPSGWPQDTSVKCDQAGAELLGDLEEILIAPLADPRTKAVTVSPRGVRVIRQAAQGARGAYLLFRDARFTSARVAPRDADAALTLALKLVGLLETRNETQRAA